MVPAMAALPLTLNVRTADTADHAAVVELLGELIDELGPSETADHIKAMLPEDINHALHSERVCIFLAYDGNALIGLSRADVLTTDPIFRLRDDHRCGYVDQMFVRPQWRGRRIGKELLNCCEHWFREQGIGHSLLHAAPKAVRFYAREGYQPNREMFKRL